MGRVPLAYKDKVEENCIQRKTERAQLLGSGESLLQMFLPVIPELEEMSATEEEIRKNLQLGGRDIYDVYQHRTACANCTFADHDRECSFPIQEYKFMRIDVGLVVETKPVNSCKAKGDPYNIVKHEELLEGLKLPKEFQKKALENYNTKNDSQHKAVGKSRQYVQNFVNHALQGEGLVFSGPTGTGKTHLVVGVAKKIIQQYLVYVRFVDVGVWASDFVYGSKSFEEKKKIIEGMKKASVLILDDLGAELGISSKATAIGAVKLILMERYNELRPTIITTNIQTEELQDYLGKRVWSRLQGKNLNIPLIGRDCRIEDNPWSDLGKLIKL